MRLLSKLNRFRSLSDRERRAFVEAAFGVFGAQVAISVLPFRTVHRLTRKLRWAVVRYDALKAQQPGTSEEVARAVERAGRQIPRARCLSRALAGSVILARHGHQTRLRIGVRRPGGEGFEAHAWLEREGEVLVGGPATGFVPFPSLD